MKIYLSGEIHTDWRDQIINGTKDLDISFFSPVTTDIRPKIATTTGRINGAPSIIIKIDLPIKDCLVSARAKNIPKIELIVADIRA